MEETHRLRWKFPVDDYFDLLSPDVFEAENGAVVNQSGSYSFALKDLQEGQILTFSFQEQIVGWPSFRINAPEGTQVELMVQEAHRPYGSHPDSPPIMNNHFNAWTRFICREGANYFECFDYESLRWVQLHVHGAIGKVSISEVRVRRRSFPFEPWPSVHTSNPVVNTLIKASINTVVNACQETIVDGMGRERQQYSGDVGHQLHALHLAFGNASLGKRYLRTFSEGLTQEGYFLDTWPAYDRLNRLPQRQLKLTLWGPLLDHGVGFVFDCYYHYMYSGDAEIIREVFPRLNRFRVYLNHLLDTRDLLPVENIGVPTVWMDTDAYQKQRHKQCAFNLYVAGMLKQAFAPLARALGKTKEARAAQEMSDRLVATTIRRFWDSSRQLFVNNLPWLEEEKNIRLCDRSLAQALLFEQCPPGNRQAVIDALVNLPDYLGRSYPANAGWYLWALAAIGRTDKILDDLQSRWYAMASVKANNTMQEAWSAQPDSNSQWSHCAVAPLYVAYTSLAGMKPLKAGFRRVEIRPQPANLEKLELVVPTQQGNIDFSIQGKQGDRTLKLRLPEEVEGELVLPIQEQLDLPEINLDQRKKRYLIRGGKNYQLSLKEL